MFTFTLLTNHYTAEPSSFPSLEVEVVLSNSGLSQLIAHDFRTPEVYSYKRCLLRTGRLGLKYPPCKQPLDQIDLLFEDKSI